jgi:GTP-binding protein LepA
MVGVGMKNPTPIIHNFCIIAHIDHGKSTLADRMLELTGTVEKRKMKEQLLDSMELEREKGITIKLQPVRMQWKGSVFNLIDTPGHVDFQYEVSRSLQAVEGAIVLVDATQGVQAQTIANVYLALEHNLTIIPVINKIDLPAANVPEVTEEIVKLLGVDPATILSISAKTGAGVEAVLDAIAATVPPATLYTDTAFRSLIFDSLYDDYKGVVAYVRVINGTVRAGERITFLGTDVSDRVIEVGIFSPEMTVRSELHAGEIGYLATGLKDVHQARVGDTIARESEHTKVTALPGFAIPQPKVFAGIYPVNGDDFPALKEAISELQLSDASLTASAERNEALGQGFRCGFLGMLHLEIIQERLKREYNLPLVITTPSVRYRITLTNGTTKEALTPVDFPDPSQITQCAEQMAKTEVIVPPRYMGAVFEVMKFHEGELIHQEFLGSERIILHYIVPLRELVIDLYDHLKSATAGFGSLHYELSEWRPADVIKLSVMINHAPVEALSIIVPRQKAEAAGRRMVARLKEVIPRQLFAIPLQAAIGGKVVARETLAAMRKDVTGYLYGGDVTRKKKLLEKQKKGKKKMANIGSVDIPPRGLYCSV